MPSRSVPATDGRRRPRRRWVWGSLAIVGLALLAVGILWMRLPDDDEVARRAAQAFEQRFGIGLHVGRARWALRPQPVIEFDDLATQQQTPITLRRMAAYPQWRALLQRRIEFSRVDIDGLVLPRQSVRAFRSEPGNGDQQPDIPFIDIASGGWALADIPVHTLRFRDVAWIDRRDIRLSYDGEVAFDAHWRPREAHIERPGVLPPARARIVRDGEVLDDSAGRGNIDTERWRVVIEVGGGSWDGQAQLATAPDGRLRLQATLVPKDVDLEALTAAFARRSAVAGRMSGQTTLDAAGARPGELILGLHTRTLFTVQPATVRRFDLAKAVATAGIERDGQTALDELRGALDTQATEDGTILRYTDLKARSGVLTASGHLRVLNRRMQGEVTIDIVDGVVGFPLKLGGTLDKPELSLTGGALAGAAAGSAVMPGVGTVIGARIGQQVERAFGGSKATSPRKRPKPRQSPRP